MNCFLFEVSNWPSFSLSIRTFFRATISFVLVSRARSVKPQSINQEILTAVWLITIFMDDTLQIYLTSYIWPLLVCWRLTHDSICSLSNPIHLLILLHTPAFPQLHTSRTNTAINVHVSLVFWYKYSLYLKDIRSYPFSVRYYKRLVCF